ncbi:PKD domain-containing protein [Geodermatophilus sp. URMC 64]
MAQADAAPRRARYRRRRAASAPVAVLLALGLLVLGLAVPGAASADTRPDAGVPATFAADGLGTVQVNGVVWAMTTVGNTVYATGSFTRARPAGAAAGVNETARANLLAFNLTTGVMTSFNHALNGQGRTITASPDGTRIYVGGDFTTVDGIARGHVAAFSTATGALLSTFAPNVSGAVHSLAATNSTVYAGGMFFTAGGKSRTRLAAFNAANGAVTTWAPTANHTVRGIALSPDGTRVVLGGQFSQVNGAAAVAVASVNTAGTDMRTWDLGITNSGDAGGAHSLRAAGTTIYVTLYGFMVGNIEGTVALDANTLDLVWMNDCHGDPYDTFTTGGVVYTAGHQHDCETSGSYPNPVPTTWQRVIANTVAPTCTLKATTQTPRYTSWAGRPCPSVLTFFPTLAAGTYTGQSQAAWTLTGNSNYMVLGGEFPTVNGARQQGLVRVATTAIAPNRRGPELTAARMQPAAVSNAPGEVTVTWPSSWDMDNQTLTYALYRTGTATPIHTTTVTSDWWKRQNLTFTETRPAGSTASYSVRVSDPFGNTVTSTTSPTVTVASQAQPYAIAVLADAPAAFWRMGETSGTAIVDSASNFNLTAGAGIGRTTAGAVTGNGAITGHGTSTGRAVTSQQVPQFVQTRASLSVEAWVRTTSTAGGIIAQYGNSASGAGGTTDRTLYVDAQGRVSFGYSRTQNNVLTYTTIQSPAAVNDGRWHHVVASTANPGGTTLYVDGAQVANIPTLTRVNTQFTGWWVVGGGTTTALTNRPAAAYLNGSLDEVAIYPAALTAAQVAGHYSTATGTTTNPSPTASFTSTVDELTVSVDGSGSTDTAPGTIAAYSWNWGDNTPAGNGATATHAYAAPGSYPVTLTVTDDGGATATTSRTVTVTGPANTPPTASFTATPTGLQVAVDGSASTDAQGPIASYSWNWGDGTAAGSGATATHSYAVSGTYTVTLTVRDSADATGTATRTVTVTAPGVAPFAQDGFARTVPAGSWGTADVGGAWTASAGAARLSVTPGAGVLNLPAAGNNTAAYLGGVARTSADITASFSLSSMPTGGGTYVYVTGRRVAGQGEYRVRLRVAPDGQVYLALSRLTGTTEAWPNGEVTVTGLRYQAGGSLNVRVRVSGTGTTQVLARVWAGTAEPATWQLSRTDTTAVLQAAGAVGLAAYRTSSATAATAVRFTAFSAGPVA